jgi:small subunit ribosomal protein S3
MGQKVNPHGLRVGVIKNWDSRWFAKDEVFGDTLVSDYNVRKYLKKELYDAGISKIEIERDGHRVRVFVNCAKPGMVIGRGGVEIEKYRLQLEKMVGMPVSLNVVEIRQPDLDAQLVAENIAKQLENRVAFRRAMKMSIRNTMRLGAKGIKINCSGRLGGAEIARAEHYHEGTIPLQTLRADIEYGFAEAHTTYGKIGIKVWIFKGEVLPDVKKKFTTIRTDMNPARPDRRDRKPGERRGDRRDGDRRPQNRGQNRGQGNRPAFQGSRNNAGKEGGNK